MDIHKNRSYAEQMQQEKMEEFEELQKWEKDIASAENLHELYLLLRAVPDYLRKEIDFSALPNWGPAPEDTMDVWSWDISSVIHGEELTLCSWKEYRETMGG